MGGIIDGCPSGCTINLDQIKDQLQRRQGGSPYTTARREPDALEILSGIHQGKTIGTPLAFIVRNQAHHSSDYDQFATHYRPGHGDHPLRLKYPNYDHRGGGRSSARETVSWVVAGTIALQILQQLYAPELTIHAQVETIGGTTDYHTLLRVAQQHGDTLGGTIRCRIQAEPKHLIATGEPLFHKLNASLAHAMMSIPSAIAFEMGAGFSAASMWGSQYVDAYTPTPPHTIPHTATNHCGGIQAGIANGMPIEFRVALHPIATLPQGIDCIDDDNNITHIIPGGRHDTCQVLRTPVIVESLAAHTLLDLKLQSR